MAQLIGSFNLGFHPAQNLVHDLLLGIFKAQLEGALATQAVQFPAEQRDALIAEWRREAFIELADHFGQEAGFSDVHFIEYE